MNTVPTTEPTRETATAAEVWHRLGEAIGTHNLPAPSSITHYRLTESVGVELHTTAGHTLTDWQTWVAWLGSTGMRIEGSGRWRWHSAEAEWRGWRIEVTFYERMDGAQ